MKAVTVKLGETSIEIHDKKTNKVVWHSTESSMQSKTQQKKTLKCLKLTMHAVEKFPFRFAFSWVKPPTVAFEKLAQLIIL